DFPGVQGRGYKETGDSRDCLVHLDLSLAIRFCDPAHSGSAVGQHSRLSAMDSGTSCIGNRWNRSELRPYIKELVASQEVSEWLRGSALWRCWSRSAGPVRNVAAHCNLRRIGRPAFATPRSCSDGNVKICAGGADTSSPVRRHLEER